VAIDLAGLGKLLVAAAYRDKDLFVLKMMPLPICLNALY
jgi:hypothetical protein